MSAHASYVWENAIYAALFLSVVISVCVTIIKRGV